MLELLWSYAEVILKYFEFILVTLALYSSHSSIHLELLWSYLDLFSNHVGVVLGGM